MGDEAEKQVEIWKIKRVRPVAPASRGRRMAAPWVSLRCRCKSASADLATAAAAAYPRIGGGARQRHVHDQPHHPAARPGMPQFPAGWPRPAARQPATTLSLSPPSLSSPCRPPDRLPRRSASRPERAAGWGARRSRACRRCWATSLARRPTSRAA